METDYRELMSSKSEDSLWYYLENPTKYAADVVEAAIEELRRRGHPVTAEEAEAIFDQYRLKELAEKEKEEAELYGNQEEEDLPELYGPNVILIFAILFGVLFGSVMMALNVNRINKRGVIPVLGFGIGYTVIQLIVASYIPYTGFFLTVIGAIMLKFTFWPNYIGKDTPFQQRSVGVPLLIGIGLGVLFLIAMLSSIPE